MRVPEQIELFEPPTKKYQVSIPEVHYCFVEVEVPAGSSEEEIYNVAEEELANNGPDDMEYSHTMGPDMWQIEEI